MTTALDIINGAARLIGVNFKSESLSADEASDGLTSLNDMISSWSNDDLVIYETVNESFPLVSGTATYSIGTGHTFNTTRPTTIGFAFIRQGNIDYAIDIISKTDYDAIPFKSDGNGLPRKLVYDASYPYASIKLYPIPSTGYTLFLESNKPITELASLNTTFSFPPGWKRAVKYNLAIEMAPEYGVEPSATVVSVARKSLGNIRRTTLANNPMPFLGDPLSYPSYPSILNDGF